MALDTKIYKVTAAEGSTMLIRAKTRASALGIAASAIFKAELASQEDLVELVSKGAKVIEAEEPVEA